MGPATFSGHDDGNARPGWKLRALMAARVQAVLAKDAGAMNYEIRDLDVVPGHGVAFCYGLHHVQGTTRTARNMFRRAAPRGGGWSMVVHEHSSVPFDMKTGEGLVQPQAVKKPARSKKTTNSDLRSDPDDPTNVNPAWHGTAVEPCVPRVGVGGYW